MAQPRHVFETYIKASPDRVWQALTDPELSARYLFDSGLVSTRDVVEADPPRRLVMAFRALCDDETAAEPASRVTWEITPLGGVCRLTCIHTDLFGAPRTWAATADGWNVILSSMKTLLETGEPLGAVPDDGGSPFGTDMEPERQWHRSLGIDCNNGAYDLLEKVDRTDDETETMVDLAHAAKLHWSKAGGTPVNQVRADYLCARVYAFVGRAEPALHHAHRAAARATALGLDDFDLAFVHEALGRALACAGDPDGAQREVALARAVVIADAEDKAIVDADLAKQPWYGVGV